jgi:hypothetical protein
MGVTVDAGGIAKPHEHGLYSVGRHFQGIVTHEPFPHYAITHEGLAKAVPLSEDNHGAIFPIEVAGFHVSRFRTPHTRIPEKIENDPIPLVKGMTSQNVQLQFADCR